VDLDAALAPYADTVPADWVDHNDHMSSGFYAVAFSDARDRFVGAIGLGPRYVAATPYSFFTVEAHITYRRELRLGEKFEVITRLRDMDAKRLVYFNVLRHVESGAISALSESLSLHVDREKRRACEISDMALEILNRVRAAQGTLDLPPGIGKIELPPPKTA